jgi:hypothetical protein
LKVDSSKTEERSTAISFFVSSCTILPLYIKEIVYDYDPEVSLTPGELWVTYLARASPYYLASASPII